MARVSKSTTGMFTPNCRYTQLSPNRRCLTTHIIILYLRWSLFCWFYHCFREYFMVCNRNVHLQSLVFPGTAASLSLSPHSQARTLARSETALFLKGKYTTLNMRTAPYNDNFTKGFYNTLWLLIEYHSN